MGHGGEFTNAIPSKHASLSIRRVVAAAAIVAGSRGFDKALHLAANQPIPGLAWRGARHCLVVEE
jgi:hypothetical protein